MAALEGVLTVEIAGRVSRPRVCLHQWAHPRLANLPARVWSAGQQRLLDAVSTRAFVQDANELEMQKASARYVHVSCLPGCGKTEAIVYSAHCLAIDHGLHVAVACLTGVLVSLYSERLPEIEHITVQTIHCLFNVALKQDPAAYMPPGRRRSDDAFHFEEISLIGGFLWALVLRALYELPQRPVIVLAGDFGQLQPLGDSGRLQCIAEHGDIEQVFLEEHVKQRTCDAVLNDFIASIRSRQPTRAELASFFEGRMLGRRLVKAVKYCLTLAASGRRLTWLCATHRTAQRVNIAYLGALGYGGDFEHVQDTIPGDPGIGSYRMLIRPGMQIRLSRNLAKSRGFVNGALGEVQDVYCSQRNQVVVSLLLTSGIIVLVHPICVDKKVFLPCSDGYSVTVRKAQGATWGGMLL